MARKPEITSVYEDVLPVVDAAIEQEALEKARRNAAENPVSKEDAVKVAKVSTRGKNRKQKIPEADDFTDSQVSKKKGKLYRRTFLSGYKNLLALGVQEATIARLFGIRDNAFSNIKQNGDEGIKKAYKAALAELESVLTASMLGQALGYEYTEIKTTYVYKKIDDGTQFKKDIKPSKKLVKTKVEKTRKHYPGKPQLFMYYMATHFPEKWKLKSMGDGGGVHFHITGDIVKEQISNLADKYLTAPAKVIDNEIIENPDSD